LLKEKCDEVGIHFLSSPYAFEMVDHLDPYVPAYKVGSGDITWHDIIRHMARCKKPLLLACGASSMDEVQAAMKVALEETAQVCLMQCNTNYTGNIDNLHHVNLNVLSTFRAMYPEAILGLSDHTPGHATVLGAIALGARVIEKHFTDDTNREGPDHHFAMDPQTWREMVDRSRELEAALGDGQKRIEVNEQETVVVQRRSLRLKRDLVAGQTIRSDDLIALRPCPSDALPPSVIERVLGMTLNENKAEGEHLTWRDLV
jgi:N-acetylneuraminate synthase